MSPYTRHPFVDEDSRSERLKQLIAMLAVFLVSALCIVFSLSHFGIIPFNFLNILAIAAVHYPISFLVNTIKN